MLQLRAQETLLRNKNERKAGVQHMYVKNLFDIAKEKLQARPGSMPKTYPKIILKRQGQYFDRVDDEAYLNANQHIAERVVPGVSSKQ